MKLLVAIKNYPGSSGLYGQQIPDGKGGTVTPQPLQGATDVVVFVIEALAAFEIMEVK